MIDRKKKAIAIVSRQSKNLWFPGKRVWLLWSPGVVFMENW
jgi:hypothetical protein